MQTTPSAIGVFQAHFGAPPRGQDAKAECEKWERRCAELLAERERLRVQLAKERAAHEKTVLKMMCAEADPNLTMAQIYAQVDRDTPIEQLIAELEAELEKKA